MTIRSDDLRTSLFRGGLPWFTAGVTYSIEAGCVTCAVKPLRRLLCQAGWLVTAGEKCFSSGALGDYRDGVAVRARF